MRKRRRRRERDFTFNENQRMQIVDEVDGRRTMDGPDSSIPNSTSFFHVSPLQRQRNESHLFFLVLFLICLFYLNLCAVFVINKC